MIDMNPVFHISEDGSEIQLDIRTRFNCKRQAIGG